MVKTPPSNTGSMGLFLVGGIRSHMPCDEAKKKMVEGETELREEARMTISLLLFFPPLGVK